MAAKKGHHYHSLDGEPLFSFSPRILMGLLGLICVSWGDGVV